ncbi:MAG: ABC transporter permease [Bryobacteraceae bacterium]|jgi:putative ABC transport system permease protein
MSRRKREFALLGAGIMLAWDAVRGHKMRSFLTVLGVIIGTGTIIGVGSILTGFDAAVTGIISSFGTDSIIVTRWPTGVQFGPGDPEVEKRKPLTIEDARAIMERCPSVKGVGPYLIAPWNYIHRVHYKSNDVYQPEIGGTTEGYVASGQAEMRFGRFFSEFEDQHRAPVVVIGADVQKNLFADEDPTGKMINVDGHEYQVLGAMKRPPNAFPGQQDNRVLIPYWTMRKTNPQAKEHMLTVKIMPGADIAKAMDEVRGVLRQQRRQKYSEPDSFGLSTAESLIENFRSVMAVTALVMVVLSSVGLLVGGIGVMNIMLVSVTERTREIGIRKAVGARRLDIIIQFLTEAVVLTFSGGLLGMLLGWLISVAARLAFPSLPTSVPLWAAGLGIGVSVGVGLFFGLWPATKAARLDPVDALRYE